MKGFRSLTTWTLTLVLLTAISVSSPFSAQTTGKGKKIFAQKLVEDGVAKHPEVTGMEIAATPPGKQCMTIAATEAKEVGEKCDKDEFTALKTKKPFVEKEKDEYDATLPLYDASGKIVGTVGMDFKLGPEQSVITAQAERIAEELAKQIPSKAKLFEPVQ